MRAVVYERFGGPMQVTRVPDPTPPLDGVVVRVAACGICRSDWHGWMGHEPDIRLPHVPGHELAGEVEAVGKEVRRWRVGDRVTVPFAVGCGQCPPCREGDLHICDRGYQPGFTGWCRRTAAGCARRAVKSHRRSRSVCDRLRRRQ